MIFYDSYELPEVPEAPKLPEPPDDPEVTEALVVPEATEFLNGTNQISLIIPPFF